MSVRVDEGRARRAVQQQHQRRADEGEAERHQAEQVVGTEHVLAADEQQDADEADDRAEHSQVQIAVARGLLWAAVRRLLKPGGPGEDGAEEERDVGADQVHHRIESGEVPVAADRVVEHQADAGECRENDRQACAKREKECHGKLLHFGREQDAPSTTL